MKSNFLRNICINRIPNNELIKEKNKGRDVPSNPSTPSCINATPIFPRYEYSINETTITIPPYNTSTNIHVLARAWPTRMWYEIFKRKRVLPSNSKCYVIGIDQDHATWWSSAEWVENSLPTSKKVRSFHSGSGKLMKRVEEKCYENDSQAVNQALLPSSVMATYLPYRRSVEKEIARDVTVPISCDGIIHIIGSKMFKTILHAVYSPLELPSKVITSSDKEMVALLLAFRTKRGQAVLSKLLNSEMQTASVSDTDMVYLTDTVNSILHGNGFQALTIGTAVGEAEDSLFSFPNERHCLNSGFTTQRRHLLQHRRRSTVRDAFSSFRESLHKISAHSKRIRTDDDDDVILNKDYTTIYSSFSEYPQQSKVPNLAKMTRPSLTVTANVEESKLEPDKNLNDEDELQTSAADLANTVNHAIMLFKKGSAVISAAATELDDEVYKFHGIEVPFQCQNLQNNGCRVSTTDVRVFSSNADPRTPSLSPQNSHDSISSGDEDFDREEVVQQPFSSEDSGNLSHPVSYSQHGQTAHSISLVSDSSPATNSPPSSPHAEITPPSSPHAELTPPSSPHAELSPPLSLPYFQPVEETGPPCSIEEQQISPLNDAIPSQVTPSITSFQEDQSSSESSQTTPDSDEGWPANSQIETVNGTRVREDAVLLVGPHLMPSVQDCNDNLSPGSEYNPQQSPHQQDYANSNSHCQQMQSTALDFGIFVTNGQIETKAKKIECFAGVAGPRSPSSSPENSLSISSLIQQPGPQQYLSDSGNSSHTDSRNSAPNQSSPRAYSERYGSTSSSSSRSRSNPPSSHLDLSAPPSLPIAPAIDEQGCQPSSTNELQHQRPSLNDRFSSTQFSSISSRSSSSEFVSDISRHLSDSEFFTAAVDVADNRSTPSVLVSGNTTFPPPYITRGGLEQLPSPQCEQDSSGIEPGCQQGSVNELHEQRPSPNTRSSSPVPGIPSRSPSPEQFDSDVSCHSSDNEWAMPTIDTTDHAATTAVLVSGVSPQQPPLHE